MACHGQEGEALQGAATDLRLRLPPNREHLESVLGGALAATGMPPVEMSGGDLEALYAFLVNTAWDAYAAQERKAREPGAAN